MMMKKILSVILVLAMLFANLDPSVLAADTDYQFVISKINLYDEKHHKIGGEITTANAGDVIVLTFAVKNNTNSNFTIGAIEADIGFDTETLSYYRKDDTDTEWEGPFYEEAAIPTLDGVLLVRVRREGVLNLGVAGYYSRISKNATTDVAQIAFKVVDDAISGIATLTFANISLANMDENTVNADKLSAENKTIFIAGKNLERVELTTKPSKLTYLEGKDNLDVSGGMLTLFFYDDSTREKVIKSDMVTGFDNTKTGAQTLTVTYCGMTATFDITVIPKSLAGIVVSKEPSKLTYLEGKEELDISGGVITLYYDNDTQENIDLTPEMVTGFDNTEIGVQTLTVTYEEKTATFDVIIVPKSVESVILKNVPSKLSYLEGKETLDVSGGTITVNYNNGTYEDVSMTSQMVSGFDNTKTGVQTLTVTYGGKTAFFDVSVVPKTLERIAVTTKPSKLTYLEGKDEFDPSGGLITLYYDNDTEEEKALTAEMVSGFDNTKTGEQILVVTYDGRKAAFYVTVVPKSLAGIEVKIKPSKLTYLEGKDELDVSGGVITLYYDNDTQENIDITAEMVTGFDNTEIGVQALTVTYEGKTASYSIEVLPYGSCGEELNWFIENGRLSICGAGAMTEYESAESAPWNKYSDGIKEIYIDAEVTAISSKGFASLSMLEKAIVNPESKSFETYNDVLYSKDKTVIFHYPGAKADTSFIFEKSVSEIADSAFANAQKITDVYFDGIMSEWKALSIGNNNEPVLNAKLHKYDLIAVEALPVKTTYLEGKDELDLTGGLLRVTIKGEEPQFIPLTSNMISGFDNTKTGGQTLTVSFLGDETSFDITVIEKSISGIEVKKNPNKLSYLEGKDALDVTGGIITVLYNNDTQEDVEMSLEMTSGFNNKVTGFQTITITYMKKTASFSIVITEKSVERIEIKMLPTKLTYLEAKDELNVSGGVIKVYYNNDTEAETAMTAEMISGFDNTVVGKQALTVSFGEKTDIFDITVIAKTLKSISVGKLPNKTSYLLNEEQFSAKGGLLTLNYDNDQSEDIELTSDMVSGYSNNKLGSVMLIVSYKGKMTFFSVNIVEELKWEFTLNGDTVKVTQPPAEGTLYAAFYSEGGKIIAFKELTLNEAQAIAAGTDKIKLFAVNDSFAPLCAAGDISVN